MAIQRVRAKANVGAGTEDFYMDQIGTDYVPVTKILLGDDDVDEGFVHSGNPMPVWLASVPLPAGAATEAGLDEILAKLPNLFSTIPANDTPAAAVRAIGQDVWVCSFASTGSVLSPDFVLLGSGTGHSFSQANGSLAIVTGTTANSDWLARSVRSWRGSLRLRASIVASQRIVNQNLVVMLADLVGENLTYNIVNTTTVDVTQTAHGFTAANVGQFMQMGGITGAAGVPGRFAIASIPDANTIRFTVAGWPASGTGTLDLFGWNYVRNLLSGTTATNLAWATQRRGWSAGDVTATINTSASPGTIIQNDLNGRDAFLMDQLRASAANPTFTTRASSYENLPDDDVELYVFIWSLNGTTAPASTTTWTIGFVSVEKFANMPVYIQGARANGNANPIPVQPQGTTPVSGTFWQATQPVSLATNTPTLAAGNNRAGFIAAAGIWFDDSATTLAANATFTGTSRDLTVTATATAFANAATYAQEFVVSAESDVSGTLWIEVSRDNTNWRRAKSVATAAITGGGQYAEIVHRPSWRYIRVGFTNGATIQGRFSIGSVAKGA